MAHDGGWCLRGIAVLKWVAILLCVITIGLTSHFENATGRFYYFYVLPIIFLIVTGITLLLYFLEVDRNGGLPWKTIEFVINLIACVLFFIGFCIGIWHIIEYELFRNFNSWTVRFLIATILEGVLALVYGYTAMQVNRVGI